MPKIKKNKSIMKKSDQWNEKLNKKKKRIMKKIFTIQIEIKLSGWITISLTAELMLKMCTEIRKKTKNMTNLKQKGPIQFLFEIVLTFLSDHLQSQTNNKYPRNNKRQKLKPVENILLPYKVLE